MFALCDDPSPSDHADCFMYVHTQVYTIIYIYTCTPISFSKSENSRCWQHDTVYINMQLPLFIRVASLLTAITNSKYFPQSALCQGTICVSNRKSGFCCECHTCLAEGARFVWFLSIGLLWHKTSPQVTSVCHATKLWKGRGDKSPLVVAMSGELLLWSNPEPVWYLAAAVQDRESVARYRLSYVYSTNYFRVRIGPCHARREEGAVNRTLRCIFRNHHQVSNRRTVNFGQILTVVMQNDRDFIELSCQYTFFRTHSLYFTHSVAYIKMSVQCCYTICAVSQLGLIPVVINLIRDYCNLYFPSWRTHLLPSELEDMHYSILRNVHKLIYQYLLQDPHITTNYKR